METELLLTIIAVVVLLFLSGFFSGSETALTASSRARIHQMTKEGHAGAKTVEDLMERPERLIGAILLGNNLVNILASTLTAAAMIQLFGEAGIAYATAIMTLLVLIFSEVLPKTYALQNADRMALFVAPIMRIVVILFSPVVRMVQQIVAATLYIFGARERDDDAEEAAAEEIRGAIALHASDGGLVKNDQDMLGSILELKDIDLSEIMVHRRAIFAVDVKQSPAMIVQQVLASPFTRIPLFSGRKDNIVGLLHSKDLLRSLHASGGTPGTIDIKEVASEPWFVPDTTSLHEQLNAFRARRSHFALVVDEYGDLQGLVTLEDILEEIVGDITDEHDVAVSGVRQEPGGTYIVDGTVTIRDLRRRYEWDLPDEHAATVAGLVMHEAKEIPKPGRIVTIGDFRIEVLRRQRNQLTKLRIMPQHGE